MRAICAIAAVPIAYGLHVGHSSMRQIVDTLLQYSVETGLLAYIDRMMSFVLAMLERRSGRAMAWTPAAAGSQWLDLRWLWIVYAWGNAMALVVFVVVDLIK